MSIEKTSAGAYRVRWREGGKNRAKTIGSKRDARAFEADIIHRQRTGELAGLDAGKQTLQQFVEQTWWPTYVKPHLERSTRESYASTWDRHISPALGGYALREITAPVLSAYFADLRAHGVGPAAIRRVKRSCSRASAAPWSEG